MLTQGLSGEAYVKASKELADIEPVVARIGDLRAAEHAQQDAEALRTDPEMRELAEAELRDLKDRIPALQHEIRIALLPKDAADERSAILEVRPAAGGDEAALFATELFGMYQRYAESRGWRCEILEYSDTELGGLKEGIAEITGRGVFARLKYESGVHRLNRVPTTESQGRIHTSTVTVAVLPPCGPFLGFIIKSVKEPPGTLTVKLFNKPLCAKMSAWPFAVWAKKSLVEEKFT